MPTEEDMLKADDRTRAFAALLTEYLKEHFEYKLPRVRLGISACTVDAQRAKYDLYLRVTPPNMRGWSRDTLVVSRIGFREQRRGHGKALLRFLVEVADRLTYTHIGIEQANPDATAFGTRFGFIRHVKERTYWRLSRRSKKALDCSWHTKALGRPLDTGQLEHY